MMRQRYRLPNGATPILLSADTANLVRDDAAGLLSYITDHPEVLPDRIAEMLFATRVARRHRALAMVTDRNGLVDALRVIIDSRDDPSVVRTSTPASAERIAFIFPGQGGQRPGMGRLFYESSLAFREEADRCTEAFQKHFGESPLRYLLDEQLPADNRSNTVQPALFTQMAGLAAMWRSFGITPNITIGHSQGEIAAAYVAGMTTLADAVLVVGVRASAAENFGSDKYAMAVVAADRDACEDSLARCSGWAQLSVINSPGLVGVSGDREAVHSIVDMFTVRGTFTRVIGVQYPAHTSLISRIGDHLRATTLQRLENPKFLGTDIDCIGATLGGPIPRDVPVDEYWFWNLRNTVRFDKAIAAAVRRDTRTFVELAEHPTLQLAVHENLAVNEHSATVVGTSDRTATDLDEFTRNLALLAVGDLNYPWECLRGESGGPAVLPLIDFPNTPMNEARLWLPPNPAPISAPAGPTVAEPTTPARLLSEEWIRLSRRSLVPPRAIGIIDHTGACADLATALCIAAEGVGARARLIGAGATLAATTGAGNDCVGDDLDTHVILMPPSQDIDDCAAAAQVADFFGNRTWWPGVTDGITDCWLVTVGGEFVAADDAPPGAVHAAASAGFRSIGADHPGVSFRHLDLPTELTVPESAEALVAALHTGDETELAFRHGGLYAKRIVAGDAAVAEPDPAPQHVLIVGGTGHLGLEFCDHFAHRGARRITLVSRSGETAAAAQRLQQIRSATSTQILVTRCDVGDQAAVSQLAEDLHGAPPDLIVHAAVDYSAIELADITTEKVDRVMRAKVVGIWRVLTTCPRTENCRVILCSSARATIGGSGQIVYAAANRMLDAMAHRLRAQGLNCVSVQWGQWTVHFDLDTASKAQLAGIGVVPMSPAGAIALGMTGLRENAIVAAFDFARARSVLEAYGYGPLLSQLTGPVIDTPAPVVQADLPRRLITLLAESIGVDDPDTIDTTAPMVSIGLDSLQALELRRRVQAEFHHDLALPDLLGGASIADVLARLGG